MSIAAGLPRPKIYVVPDPDPNAFATGRDPEHASIAVTQGLLDTVNRDELQGVVAHELSHVRNLDIRLMTVIAAMVGAAALIADWTSRGPAHGRREPRPKPRTATKGGGGGLILVFVIWLVAVVLAPIIGQALAMMVSRKREYLADASGAELTRNPQALASALNKIDEAVDPTASVKRGTANLCIADPLGRAVGLREGHVGQPDGIASADGAAHRGAARDGLSEVMAHQPGSAETRRFGESAGRGADARPHLSRDLHIFHGRWQSAGSWIPRRSPLNSRSGRRRPRRSAAGTSSASCPARRYSRGSCRSAKWPGGLALILGFWTRLAAGFAFLMVLNFQLAGGAMFHYAYLSDATGLPYLGALLALAIGGGRLPLSIRK